jgi:hypothetical protein
MTAILDRRRTRKRKSLRNLSIMGLVLVVLGVGGLRLGHYSYHNWVPAVNAGPIHMDARTERRLSVPAVGGFFILLAGIGLIAVRWRRV